MDLRKELIRIVPPAIALAFGDPITKVIGGLTYLTEGALRFREMNKEWLDRFVTNEEVMEHFDFLIKTPEFIQYLTKILNQVAYEARIERREQLLNAAWNYYLKDEKIKFDEKLLLLELLDQLSVLEVSYLIGCYSKHPISREIFIQASRMGVRAKLASMGLFTADHSSIQKAMEKVSQDFVALKEKLLETIGSQRDLSMAPFLSQQGNFNPRLDKAEIQYLHNELGRKFVELICLGDIDSHRNLAEFI